LQEIGVKLVGSLIDVLHLLIEFRYL